MWPVREARSARLDEQVGPALPVRDESTVDVRVEPLATATILVR
jgi:hypothetical protein